MDLLRETTTQNDPRLAQAQRRVDVIESRISAERDKMGITGGAVEGDAFAELVGEYEGLAVDREFAEQSYLASLATYDAALAESRRKSRYLAAHILPTTAETARFPERGVIFALVSLFLFLAWTILILVAYSLKDRR
jgi:capsular polysaccharide transport system permease protein